MSFFVWLIPGVVIGCLGSLVLRCEHDRGAVVSTGAGILGALLAGWLLTPLLGGPPGRGAFSATAVATSLLGAVVLIGLVNFLRDSVQRRDVQRHSPRAGAAASIGAVRAQPPPSAT